MKVYSKWDMITCAVDLWHTEMKRKKCRSQHNQKRLCGLGVLSMHCYIYLEIQMRSYLYLKLGMFVSFNNHQSMTMMLWTAGTKTEVYPSGSTVRIFMSGIMIWCYQEGNNLVVSRSTAMREHRKLRIVRQSLSKSGDQVLHIAINMQTLINDM